MYHSDVRYGYHCEECEEAVWPATTNAELRWLKDRRHIVLEVSRHVANGLDSWITEGLEFLDRHAGHSVIVTSRP